jgi:hypothetical protein
VKPPTAGDPFYGRRQASSATEPETRLVTVTGALSHQEDQSVDGNSRRKRRATTQTGRKKLGRQATQRLMEELPLPLTL